MNKNGELQFKSYKADIEAHSLGPAFLLDLGSASFWNTKTPEESEMGSSGVLFSYLLWVFMIPAVCSAQGRQDSASCNGQHTVRPFPK